MYTFSAKTTIHGMDPGWKENPSPYQSPDPSPTYTETPNSPVYSESGSEPGSERRDEEVHAIDGPMGLTHSEEFGSPTYSEYSPEPPRTVWWSPQAEDTPLVPKTWEELEAIQTRNLGWEKSPIYEFEDYGPTSSQVSSPPVKEEPKFRINVNGKPSGFDVEPEQMDQWRAMRLLCAQRLEESREASQRMEVKGEEKRRQSDRYSPYSRRSEHRRRRSTSRNGSSAARSHQESRKDRDIRRRRHEDDHSSRSRREDRRQSSYLNPESSRSLNSSRRDKRHREDSRRERQYCRS